MVSYTIRNAQNNKQLLETQNINQKFKYTQEKDYILIFRQKTGGNIDNSTKIVSSIVGHNLFKIEEFLEEISLASSQQLEEQKDKIMS